MQPQITKGVISTGASIQLQPTNTSMAPLSATLLQPKVQPLQTLQAIRLEALSARPQRRTRRLIQRSREVEPDDDDDDDTSDDGDYERSSYQLRKRRRVSYADADENAGNEGETASKPNGEVSLSPEGVALEPVSDSTGPIEQGLYSIIKALTDADDREVIEKILTYRARLLKSDAQKKELQLVQSPGKLEQGLEVVSTSPPKPENPPLAELNIKIDPQLAEVKQEIVKLEQSETVPGSFLANIEQIPPVDPLPSTDSVPVPTSISSSEVPNPALSPSSYKSEPVATDTPTIQSPSVKEILSPTSVTSENPDKVETPVMVTEFLVKWKDKSYVHCEWISEEQIILQEGPTGKNKIKRFWQKQHSVEELEDPIPVEYTQVDRILASGEVQIEGEGAKVMYLVKWCTIPYTEATWEFAEDFKDDKKIEEYKKFHILPATPVPAPLPSRLWVKMEQSPEYKNNNSLRKYQLEGLNWLIYCWCQGRGSILADEVFFK